MEHFIFSLNATFPIFFVMLVGNLLRRIGLLDEDFAIKADKLVYYVCIPISVGLDIAKTNIREDFDLRFVVFCAGATTIGFFTIWMVARLFIRDKGMIGAFVQGSFRGSAAVLGIAFVQSMYGSSGMAPMMVAVAVPLFNIFAVLVLTVEAPNQTGKTLMDSVKTTLWNIWKNPIIRGILIAVVISYFAIPIPTMVDKTLQKLGVLATPLAILSLGVSFQGAEAIAKIKPTLIASMIKLVILPAIFLPLAVGMGFREEMLIAILIMLGAPTTVSCYIMAKNMKGDAILTSSIVATTTVLSSISLTLWIYLLRVWALI